MVRWRHIREWRKPTQGGDAAACATECSAILAQAPADKTAQIFLGISLLRLGRNEEAAQVLEKLAAVNVLGAPQERADPRSVELYTSIALRKVGRHTDALAHAEKAVTFRKNDVEAICHLGLCLAEVGRTKQAEAKFKQVIELAPQIPFGYQGLGACYESLDRRQEAIAQYRTAARLSPASAPILIEVAERLAALDDTQSAEEAAMKAHQAAPSLKTNLILASARVQRGKAIEAEPFALAAVAADPRSGDAWAMLGVTQQALRQREESVQSLLRSAELQPGQGSAWHALVQSGITTAELAAKIEAARRSPGIGDNDLSLLNLSLGRCYEKLGEYDKAFEAYSEANSISRKLKFGNQPFDAQRHRSQLKLVVDIVAASDGPLNAAKEEDGPRPIFVFGMIRSGTTLVEQILSSHPDVAAGGEITFWTEHSQSCFDNRRGQIDREVLDRLRSRYLRQLSKLAAGAPVIVDKMPLNYMVLGVIALAFPDAPLIHVQRDRADTCFSIFCHGKPVSHGLHARPRRDRKSLRCIRGVDGPMA